MLPRWICLLSYYLGILSRRFVSLGFLFKINSWLPVWKYLNNNDTTVWSGVCPPLNIEDIRTGSQQWAAPDNPPEAQRALRTVHPTECRGNVLATGRRLASYWHRRLASHGRHRLISKIVGKKGKMSMENQKTLENRVRFIRKCNIQEMLAVRKRDRKSPREWWRKSVENKSIENGLENNLFV